MRIWDIHPGYLNRQSLLGEHRELHGIVSILTKGKKGYAKHPETLRWKNLGWALRQRHRLLIEEMKLRGYKDHTPVYTRRAPGIWPSTFLDPPGNQFAILSTKYSDKAAGRIPLPQSTQELWRHHKYSVMARSPSLYHQFGREISQLKSKEAYEDVALKLVETLHCPPPAGRLKNAAQHMWGYVSPEKPKTNSVNWSIERLLKEIQIRVIASQETYLVHSTALSELLVWI